MLCGFCLRAWAAKACWDHILRSPDSLYNIMLYNACYTISYRIAFNISYDIALPL